MANCGCLVTCVVEVTIYSTTVTPFECVDTTFSQAFQVPIINRHNSIWKRINRVHPERLFKQRRDSEN